MSNFTQINKCTGVESILLVERELLPRADTFMEVRELGWRIGQGIEETWESIRRISL